VPAGQSFSFDRFALDPQQRRVTRDGEPIAIADRHFDVLHHLVSHAGAVVSKDALVAAGWGDVAVTDNSLEQAVSALRRALGRGADGNPYIDTVQRRGYRFRANVTRVVARETDAGLEALLAPHRAWLEGRAALETLEREQILRAREVFETVLTGMPGQALPHIGLANACAMQFEMTRTDTVPDTDALAAAAGHAREACRLDPGSAEGWATLGFVLDRSGHHVDALAAIRRAVSLEPDNWRHYFRLSYVSWGEERLRAARRTLALLPGFPLAHWMAATVLVARQRVDEAEHELAAGIAMQDRQDEHARFSAVALHWLAGLVHLARGDEERAAAEFERELAFESTGHLYARECCANTWYAMGALRLRQGRPADAAEAFERALERVATHPLARLALAAVRRAGGALPSASEGGERLSVDAAICRAAAKVLCGDHDTGARLVEDALAAAPAGNAGWLLPVEPLLHVTAHADAWAPALERLRARSA
jgi:DNA-binding winged helix-turn-helix (wHTH) protein/Tfp pilus assembly protein PilF